MSNSDNHDDADAAMKALVELFSSKEQLGKSSYSAIRYNLTMLHGQPVFTPNADDLAFEKFFNDLLDEMFGPTNDSSTKSKR